MLFWLAITLFLASVMLHEIGHAIAMHRRGVSVRRIALGFRIPHLPKFCFEFQIKMWPGVRFCLYPIPLGAFVEPTVAGIEIQKDLPYSEKAVIFEAGIVTNVLFCFLISAISSLMLVSSKGWHQLLWALLSVFLFVLLWWGRRFFCRYCIPLFGIGMIVILVWSFKTQPVTEVVTGPVGIVVLAKDYSTDIIRGLDFAALISLSIGLLNCLPIVPLDGGQIVDSLLQKVKVRDIYLRWFRYGGVLLFFAIVATALLSDIIRCLR